MKKKFSSFLGNSYSNIFNAKRRIKKNIDAYYLHI